MPDSPLMWIAVILGALVGALVLFVLLFAGYVLLRVKLDELRKRLAVDTTSLNSMRSKYGAVISEVRTRFEPFDAAKRHAARELMTDKNVSDSGNLWVALFDRAVPGPPAARHARLFGPLDSLMDNYATMKPDERAATRQLMSHHSPVLRGYQYSASSMLRETKQPVWLLRGLAAASIENCQCDFRDSIAALDDTLKTADELGLGWRNALTAVAAYSDEGEPLGGGKGTPWLSTKAYLEGRARIGTE